MNQQAGSPNSHPTDQPLEQAKALLFQGKFDESDKICAALLTEDDSNIDALYLYGVSMRQQKRFPEALALFAKIHDINPNHSRTWQEKGHTCFTQERNNQAIENYERAVQLNPALIASWKALVNLYQIKKQKVPFDYAVQQLEELAQLPPELQAVKSYFHDGKIDIADEVCRQFLRNNKQHIEGMRLLAQIAHKLNVVDDAEFLLESCVEFEPNHVGARIDYASTLIKRQKFGKAHDISRQLLSEDPHNSFLKALHATTTSGIGDTQGAVDLYEEVLVDQPKQDQTLLSLGHAYKTLGNLEKSVDAYRRVYQLRPDFGDAFWSLANTKTYRFTEQEVQHMLDYEAQPSTSTNDRVHLCFALGKSYEDQKDYARAFEFYQRGNALNKDELGYQNPKIIKRTQRHIDVCSAELLELKAGLGHDAPDPIFIVGLPRAGSTLLEQILASHSQVDGTLELPNILSLAYRLRGRYKSQNNDDPQYPRILGELEDSYFARFGEQYINDTKVYRQGAPLFIDKMPNNFQHIALIKLILPNAKVIDARRHPMACCFSGFKQLFAEGQEFTYGLKEIGTYYREYVRLMDHWDQVLSGFVLRVEHEDVVENLEQQVRRILDFCGLEFEQSCVEFHKTERSIRTPSAEQVRQPIYKTGLEQWKNFEPWLEPLKEALGPEILNRYPIN